MPPQSPLNDENWRIKQLLSLLDHDSKDEFVLFALAQEYAQLEVFRLAESYYNQLKELNPNYVGLYYHLAKLYETIDQSEKALATYREGERVAQELKDMHALGELKNARINLELEI